MDIERRLATFDPVTVEKVMRLFDLMEGFNAHPDLRGKFAMHGGTAVNLFLLDMPRLSVDIDMCYIATTDRERMIEDKPIVEKAIEEMGSDLGFRPNPRRGEHSGRTFLLAYSYGSLTDHVKIDVNYLHRSPLLPVAVRTSPLRPETRVATLSDAELIGGKICAYLERVQLRDLYDLNSINRFLSDKDEQYLNMVHKVALYYYTISKRFPQSLAYRSRRFSELEGEIGNQLEPVIENGARVSLDFLCEKVEALVDGLTLPRNEREQEYASHFSQGEFRPELLFDDATIVDHARKDPAVLWKLQNIMKALDEGRTIS